MSLAELYKRLGFIPPDQDIMPIVMALEDALPDVLDASVSELNFKNVINKLGDVMYSYPFRYLQMVTVYATAVLCAVQLSCM
jgi:predicted unusual protein kinase regulating ubiquinone biosynthesis (AarF/ABC1/UbiB family)